MKHLIIDRKGRKIRIIHQTHRGFKFSGEESSMFISRDGFFLWSCAIPMAAANGLFVQGSVDHEDRITINIYSDQWLKRLKSEVREYNDRFRTRGEDLEAH